MCSSDLQYETRCTQNRVHLVLNEEEKQNPFWRQPETLTLLGKGPKFIPKAKSLSTSEVLEACAIFKFRMVRAFERFVRKKELKFMDDMRQEAGIIPWTPKRRSLDFEYCNTYVRQFFKCAEENSA